MDGKRYSPLDRAEVHADMAVDWAATRRAILAQPLVAEAHRDCAECAGLAPAAPPVPTRTGVVSLRLSDVASMLGLPAGYRVLYMHVVPSTQELRVVVGSDELHEVAYGAAPPHLT